MPRFIDKPKMSIQQNQIYMMLIVQIFLSLQEDFAGSLKYKFQILEKYQHGAIL